MDKGIVIYYKFNLGMLALNNGKGDRPGFMQ